MKRVVAPQKSVLSAALCPFAIMSPGHAASASAGIELAPDQRIVMNYGTGVSSPNSSKTDGIFPDNFPSGAIADTACGRNPAINALLAKSLTVNGVAQRAAVESAQFNALLHQAVLSDGHTRRDSRDARRHGKTTLRGQ